MHQINSHNKAVTPRETVRKGASLAARQTEPADVEVLNIAASAPIFKKQKKKKQNSILKFIRQHKVFLFLLFYFFLDAIAFFKAILMEPMRKETKVQCHLPNDVCRTFSASHLPHPFNP
jgi:hypothetical protein